MKTNLADIISEINQSTKTGILSLSVKNDTSLYKIFFRDGIAYHMTFGTWKDSECLARLGGLNIVMGCFMPGAHVALENADLPTTEELIRQIKKTGKILEWAGKGECSPDAAVETTPGESIVDGGVLVKMEEELVNCVGPVAQMVLEGAFNACHLKKGTPISKTQFRRLIEVIGERLPDEQKERFISKIG